MEEREITIYLPGAPRARYSPAITFVDAGGHWWYRHEGGRLQQISSLKAAELMKEDAGAYQSVDAHPTLQKNPDGKPAEGVRIQTRRRNH